MLPNPYLEYVRILCRHEAIPSLGLSLDLVRYRAESWLGSGEFVVLYSVFESRRVCIYVDGKEAQSGHLPKNLALPVL
jgi:hypothetical protein